MTETTEGTFRIEEGEVALLRHQARQLGQCVLEIHWLRGRKEPDIIAWPREAWERMKEDGTNAMRL